MRSGHMSRTARRQLIHDVAGILREASRHPPHYWVSRSNEDWVEHLSACIDAPTFSLLDGEKIAQGVSAMFAVYQNEIFASMHLSKLLQFDEGLCDGKLGLRQLLATEITVSLLRSTP